MVYKYKKGQEFTDFQKELYHTTRIIEQRIKDNIKYIGQKKGISIYRLFKQLEADGMKAAKSNFYKKIDDPRPNAFMKTLLLCHIAQIMQVDISVLLSPNIEAELL